MAAATTADVASAADVEELAAVDTESHPSKDLLNREAETRTADKKRQKAQKRLAAEFVQAMSSSIQSLEESMQSGTAAEKELAKQRRLQLREVLKAVTDPSRSTDERLRFLQGKFVQMVQNMNKQDQDMLAVQAKLDEAVKESMQAQTELSRANQKAEKLQKLARTLQAENKLLEEDSARKKAAIESFQQTAEKIQDTVAHQSAESKKMLDTNKELLEENVRLRQQNAQLRQLLQESDTRIEALSTAQKEQLEGIQENMQHQAEWIAKSQELHSHMGTLLEQNKLLTAQAETAEQRSKHLEHINDVYKEQLELITQKADAGIATAASQKKLNDKLQQELERQRTLTPKLLQELKVRQQEVAVLQGRVKEQADELRRMQVQKQQLEGLCRALQARAGAGAEVAGNGAAGSSSGSNTWQAGCSEDAEVARACSALAKAAVAAVVAQNS